LAHIGAVKSIGFMTDKQLVNDAMAA